MTDSHLTSSVTDCRLITLDRHSEVNGALSVVENSGAFPFAIRRVYYLYDVPGGAERGGHSHHTMQSLMVAAAGSFTVTVDDGVATRSFTLSRPYQALYIPAGIWRTVRDFASGSVCLNMVSEPYDEADYVREYADFKNLTAGKGGGGGKRYPFLDLGTVNAPYLDEVRAAALRVIDSGRYIGGEEVEALEKDLCDITGAPYAVAVSNGLDALRLIMRAYIEMGRLRYGDEVIVPADTFIASVLAVTDCGLTPVFVDPDPATFNLSAAGIEAAITPRTRAVLPVHLYGRVSWDADTAAVCRRHGLLVIEDSCQALGAVSTAPGLFGTRGAGSLGHASAVSFYPTKNIGAMGDAGAVTTNDGELAATIRALRNYGSDRQYHNLYRGLNCRLDPIQAAILRAKLPYLRRENDARRRMAAIYDREITNPMVVKPLYSGEESEVWHQYVVRVTDRHAFRKFLEDRGVETAIHYPTPPHLQPCYSCYADLDLPVAEQIAREVVSLPISSCTSPADAAEIAAIINEYKQ